MKKILFVALTVFATAANAETATQSLDLKNTTVKTTGTSNFTAPDGQSMQLVNTAGSVSTSTVSAPVTANVGELLSLKTVEIGGQTVQLADTKADNGKVCHEYVKQTSVSDGKVSVTKDTFCDGDQL